MNSLWEQLDIPSGHSVTDMIRAIRFQKNDNNFGRNIFWGRLKMPHRFGNTGLSTSSVKSTCCSAISYCVHFFGDNSKKTKGKIN
jgi:hypothetical protein